MSDIAIQMIKNRIRKFNQDNDDKLFFSDMTAGKSEGFDEIMEIINASEEQGFRNKMEYKGTVKNVFRK